MRNPISFEGYAVIISHSQHIPVDWPSTNMKSWVEILALKKGVPAKSEGQGRVNALIKN